MNHPLTRIFIPISMIVLVAASSVAISTTVNFDRMELGQTAVTTAMTGAGRSQASGVIQAGLDQS